MEGWIDGIMDEWVKGVVDESGLSWWDGGGGMCCNACTNG